MVTTEGAFNSDPWHSPEETVNQTVNRPITKADSNGLRDSHGFPMLLLVCFAFLMFKASVQLLCLSIAFGILVYRRLRQFFQQADSVVDRADPSDSSQPDSNPALAMT